MSLESREAELLRLHSSIKDGLAQVDSGKSKTPKEDVAALAAKLKTFYAGLERVKFDIGDLEEDQRRVWKRKFKDLKGMYAESLNAVKAASAQANRDELLETADGGVEEEETEERFIKRGEELLDSNKSALKQTLATVNEAKNVGGATAKMLEEQNAQMGRIADDLDVMEGQLKVSQRIMRQMARRMMTDKYIWIFIGLGVMAIIAVIVVSQVV
jgi:hypothetical protein